MPNAFKGLRRRPSPLKPEKEEQLTARLTGEDKELFQNYVSAYIEFATISNTASFISGFRIGARFTYDTFIVNT